MGHVLETLLREEIEPLGLVGNVRGRGLFWTVEFMRDKRSKTPFKPGAKFCDKVVLQALDLGLNILGNLGSTGEVHVEHVIISPPYIVTAEELRQMVSLLKQAILDVSASVSNEVGLSKI